MVPPSKQMKPSDRDQYSSSLDQDPPGPEGSGSGGLDLFDALILDRFDVFGAAYEREGAKHPARKLTGLITFTDIKSNGYFNLVSCCVGSWGRGVM